MLQEPYASHGNSQFKLPEEASNCFRLPENACGVEEEKKLVWVYNASSAFEFGIFWICLPPWNRRQMENRSFLLRRGRQRMFPIVAVPIERARRIGRLRFPYWCRPKTTSRHRKKVRENWEWLFREEGERPRTEFSTIWIEKKNPTIMNVSVK